MHTPFTRGVRGDDASRRVATILRAAAAAGALLTSVSCSDSTPPDKSGTFFGPTVAMANGSARAYVSLDRAGTPTDVGLAFSESAPTGLPTRAAEFVLALPSQASATSFKHAVINWVRRADTSRRRTTSVTMRPRRSTASPSPASCRVRQCKTDGKERR